MPLKVLVGVPDVFVKIRLSTKVLLVKNEVLNLKVDCVADSVLACIVIAFVPLSKAVEFITNLIARPVPFAVLLFFITNGVGTVPEKFFIRYNS